jgi:hypothetical protein
MLFTRRSVVTEYFLIQGSATVSLSNDDKKLRLMEYIDIVKSKRIWGQVTLLESMDIISSK